jgi:hypothetical protein
MSSLIGTDDGVGYGVKGNSGAPHAGQGVEGFSDEGDGVFGQTKAPRKVGVRGIHTGHYEAIAVSGELARGLTAVKGQQGGGSGAGGDDVSGSGVWGDSTNGAGVVGTSSVAEGVLGEGNSFGVRGASTEGAGVFGESAEAEGVRGLSHSRRGGVAGSNDSANGGPGVFGSSENAEGVHGETKASTAAAVAGFALNRGGVGPGVFGQSVGGGPGVLGQAAGDLLETRHGDIPKQPLRSTPNAGVVGTNDHRKGGPGVFGASQNGEGVHGETSATGYVAAVSGLALNRHGIGPGVQGESKGYAPGVTGLSRRDAGVFGLHGDPQTVLQGSLVGEDANNAGVFGATDAGAGVLGYSSDENSPAVYAYGQLKAIALDKPLAGWFVGDVQVDGDLCLPGADCAEHFDVATDEQIEAGAVVVIDEEGALRECRQPYDRRVAGVVSGAGQYRTAIIMDKRDTGTERLPVALMGKVYCKVDARYSAIAVGDLLTSSPTPGHAMGAMDSAKAFGAVIGKALQPWRDGRGLIQILVGLR